MGFHANLRTRLDLVLKGVLAVHKDLVQVLRLVRQTEVHGLPQLVGLVPVEDLGLAVVALANVVHEDVEHLLQELTRRTVRVLARRNREQICLNKIIAIILVNKVWPIFTFVV